MSVAHVDQIRIRIPFALKKRFTRVCDAEAVNMSALMRSWVEDYTERKEAELVTRVAEVIERKPDFPTKGEAYEVGLAVDGRYYFAWGPDYPGRSEMPGYSIDDGESGISWHHTKEAALQEYLGAVKAVQETRRARKWNS